MNQTLLNQLKVSCCSLALFCFEYMFMFLQLSNVLLMKLALEYVNALNEQYDEDILDIINTLDSNLTDNEHKRFNERLDSLEKRLEKKRTKKLSLLQENKNKPINGKKPTKSTNKTTNVTRSNTGKSNTVKSSTTKQATVKSTVSKSTPTFSRSGRNTNKTHKKQQKNNNMSRQQQQKNHNNQKYTENPNPNPEPKSVKKVATPSVRIRTVRDNGKRITFTTDNDTNHNHHYHC